MELQFTLKTPDIQTNNSSHISSKIQ